MSNEIKVLPDDTPETLKTRIQQHFLHHYHRDVTSSELVYYQWLLQRDENRDQWGDHLPRIIVVQDFSGVEIRLTMYPFDKVSDLRQHAATLSNTPPAQILLILQQRDWSKNVTTSQLMKDEDLISFYPINRHSLVCTVAL